MKHLANILGLVVETGTIQSLSVETVSTIDYPTHCLRIHYKPILVRYQNESTTYIKDIPLPSKRDFYYGNLDEVTLGFKMAMEDWDSALNFQKKQLI